MTSLTITRREMIFGVKALPTAQFYFIILYLFILNKKHVKAIKLCEATYKIYCESIHRRALSAKVIGYCLNINLKHSIFYGF